MLIQKKENKSWRQKFVLPKVFFSFFFFFFIRERVRVKTDREKKMEEKKRKVNFPQEVNESPWSEAREAVTCPGDR